MAKPEVQQPATDETVDGALERVTEPFRMIPDYRNQYEHLIDLGDRLPKELPGEGEATTTKIQRCVSEAWLIYRREDGRFYFTGESDAQIVRGLLTVLANIFSGRTAEEINSVEFEELREKINMERLLSPGRQNGFEGAFELVQKLSRGEESPQQDEGC